MTSAERHPWPGGPSGVTPVTRPLRREMVYTREGRIGFLQSETAETVTIQFGPFHSQTLPKEEIDCRFKLV